MCVRACLCVSMYVSSTTDICLRLAQLARAAHMAFQTDTEADCLAKNTVLLALFLHRCTFVILTDIKEKSPSTRQGKNVHIIY